MKDVWVLDINEDTFNALKGDFNRILQKTLDNMERQENEVAEIKLSLKIRLTKQEAQDFKAAYDAYRDVIVPKFTHKITSEFKTKEEASGLLGTGEQELVWDPNLMKYVMRPIFDGQGDLFEDENVSEDYSGPRRIVESNPDNAEFREA
ncbi:MAG: hypothetical protein AB9858_04935 [Acidaminococcaceae bacterium]